MCKKTEATPLIHCNAGPSQYVWVSVNIVLSTTEIMTHVEALHAADADLQREKTSGQHAPVRKAQKGEEDVDEEVDDDHLSLLADVVLAPPCVEHAACNCLEFKRMEMNLQSMQLQLQFFMHKADDLYDHLVNGHGHLEREALAAAVKSFLYTCQPYFNHLESVRSNRSHHTSLPINIYTKLLDFSQQLCDKLEQLVLSYASYDVLCLDETEPKSVSPFCVGQFQLGQVKLTTFRYCKPMPYLSQVDTGLYKRMRWNVEKLQDGPKTDKDQGGESKERQGKAETEYYFLCYEDIPSAHAEADCSRPSISDSEVVRMWSIGQWEQVDPDPITENINSWILCKVPRATYNRLLVLGSEEPSCCIATDYLQQLLFPWMTTDGL